MAARGEPLHSAVYVGRVRHRRHAPKPHHFGYSLFMLYLDLAELGEVFRRRWLWSVERRNLASFRRRDYLGDPAIPLDTAVRDRAEQALGRRPTGPVRMLTHLRYWGYGFNPVTFYYCFDAEGSGVDAVVAEITNTPWGERFSYVLDGRAAAAGAGSPVVRARFAKAFHVSPFFGMDHRYHWGFSTPGERLVVHMENHREGARMFDATLSLERRPLTGPRLAACLLRWPFMTGKVIAGIYWQAARLWWKRVGVHPHPRRLADEHSAR
ncbi:MAG: DUF1365 domain-containing protein [Planctomycetes bacterium]|nr:DUF1365 domain-containing protein [Planctomycetota bacterium]